MVEETIERCREEISRLADGALAPGGGAREVSDLLARVEEVIAAALRGASRADEPPPACGAGCAACCTVNVATLGIEGAAAAAWLGERLDAPGRAERSRALLRFHDRVRWLEDEDRIADRAACPFLDDAGRCSIHPVRPLACRGLTSLDAADCRRALRERMERAEEGGEVRMNLLQRALYGDAVAQLQAALGRHGLDARCRDVSGMTGLFLAEPAWVARFLAGERLPIE